MDWKAHFQSDDSSPTKRMSRMQQDLSISPHNGNALNHLETTMLRRVIPRGRVPHVCVVGAGMAGLRCADILATKGFRVTILEARDRIGGRVGASRLTKKTVLI